MDRIIPCVLCRKHIHSKTEAGESIIYRCECGVVVIIPQSKLEKIEVAAKKAMTDLIAPDGSGKVVV